MFKKLQNVCTLHNSRVLCAIKKLALCFVFVLAVNTSFAQVLLTENFSYTSTGTPANDSLTNPAIGGAVWKRHSGVGTPIVWTAAGLTYPGYIGSGIGGSVNYTNGTGSREDANIGLSDSIKTGSVYLSFMLNVTASGGTTGDYHVHFISGSGTVAGSFGARIFIKDGSSFGTFKLGLSKGSAASTAVFTAIDYNYSQTYLVVLKYTFNIVTGTDDVVNAYILSTGVPATEPSVADLTATDMTINDLSKIYGVAIRQGTVGTSAAILDGFRVGQNWVDINSNSTTTTTIYDTINQTICSNQTFLFNGVNLNIAGQYQDTLVGLNATDTLRTLNLTVTPTSNYTINDTICSGNSYTFNNIAQTTAGTYYDTLVNAGGCDSIITLNLTVNTLPTINTSATATNTCLGSSVSISATSNAVNPIFEWTKDYITYYPITVADVPSSTATVIYSVRVTDANSCSNYNSVFMNVNPPSGILAQTTAGLSVTGFADDQQVQSANSFLHYFDANCNLIASVNLNVPGTSALDTTNAEVIVDASVQTYLNQPYCRRNFYILPKTQGSAEVTLYLNQSNFDDYNANNGTWDDLPTGPTDVAGISRVRITKVEGDGLGFSPAEVITPTMAWNGTYWSATFTVSSFSKFYFHTANPANSPLPVTLLSFMGQKETSANVLNWTTSMELNNAYFNVQHSTNARDFTTIGKVEAKQLSINNYELRDEKPLVGHNYYRLQQVDNDGKSTLSQVIDLYRDANGNVVNVYPNPTQGMINVECSMITLKNISIKLSDMSGRIIKEINVTNNITSIDLSDMAKGIYLLQVSQKNQIISTQKVERK